MRNILPDSIADRLKEAENIIADNVEDVSVMFIDIVDSVPLSAHMPAVDLVQMLNQIFSSFDSLAEKYHLEKIKTSGDSYMVVGGLPLAQEGHLEAVANMALDIIQESHQFARYDGSPMQFRIGINCGPVIAGVIGTKKFAYDLWGETVNVASRMESLSLPHSIQVTQEVYDRLNHHYLLEPRGTIDVKGKGNMPTFLLKGKRNP